MALAVAEGQGIWRFQLRWIHATDDPSPLDREADLLVAPQILLYGVPPRLTAFGILPILAHREIEAGGRTVVRDEAVGDLTLLGRYTFFQDDYAPLSSRRVALLAGMKFPSGADRFGTPSFDPILGLVGTWAADRHELDGDLLYTITTERQDLEAGDQLRCDLAYRCRLWPDRFRGRLMQLNGLVELNGSWTSVTRVDGRTLGDTGGNVLFVSPGLQFITSRFVVEASLQSPVVQDLRGPQLETDFSSPWPAAALGVQCGSVSISRSRAASTRSSAASCWPKEASMPSRIRRVSATGPARALSTSRASRARKPAWASMHARSGALCSGRKARMVG